MDELRWLRPVYPGDTLLSCEMELLDKRLSRSKPGIGILNLKMTTFNQHGEPVLTMKPITLVRARLQGSRPDCSSGTPERSACGRIGDVWLRMVLLLVVPAEAEQPCEELARHCSATAMPIDYLAELEDHREQASFFTAATPTPAATGQRSVFRLLVDRRIEVLVARAGPSSHDRRNRRPRGGPSRSDMPEMKLMLSTFAAERAQIVVERVDRETVDLEIACPDHRTGQDRNAEFPPSDHASMRIALGRCARY